MSSIAVGSNPDTDLDHVWGIGCSEVAPCCTRLVLTMQQQSKDKSKHVLFRQGVSLRYPTGVTWVQVKICAYFLCQPCFCRFHHLPEHLNSSCIRLRQMPLASTAHFCKVICSPDGMQVWLLLALPKAGEELSDCTMFEAYSRNSIGLGIALCRVLVPKTPQRFRKWHRMEQCWSVRGGRDPFVLNCSMAAGSFREVASNATGKRHLQMGIIPCRSR